jgi:DNA-binding GntR family transcriptional regulator
MAKKLASLVTEPSASPAESASGLRGDLVYGRLRADLEAGALRPGSRVREVDLAARLGVSRTPVREALKRLESEGILTFSETEGLIVTRLAPEQVVKLYALREVLEGAAARFAAEAASTEEIAGLEKILDISMPVTDPEEAEALNRSFHAAIRAATHNEYLQRSATMMQDSLILLGGSAYFVPGRIESGRREHTAILAAIAARDLDQAERLARAHIRSSSTLRLELMFGGELAAPASSP